MTSPCQEITASEEALRLFREIEKRPYTTRRELSRLLDVNLGKVNALLNALVLKGFIDTEKVKKLTLATLTATG